MICPNCGSEEGLAGKFCENCGAEAVEQEQETVQEQQEVQDIQEPVVEMEEILPEETSETEDDGVEPEDAFDPDQPFVQPADDAQGSMPETEVKKGGGGRIIGIIAAVLVVICIALGWYFIGSAQSNPDNIVYKYVDCVAKSDADLLYSIIDVNYPLTSKQIFDEQMRDLFSTDHEMEIKKVTITDKKQIAQEELDTYNIGRPCDKAIFYSFDIAYTDGGEETSAEDVYLIVFTTGAKKWLFFDEYKTSLYGIVAYDYTINAPAGADVKVNGITIPQTGENGKMGAYTIPALFAYTDYELEITHEDYSDYSDTLMANDNHESYDADMKP